MHVAPEARRSVLVDLLTVHALGGKAIIFTQTKREADEVAASVSLVHPCEVGGPGPCMLDLGGLLCVWASCSIAIVREQVLHASKYCFGTIGLQVATQSP